MKEIMLLATSDFDVSKQHGGNRKRSLLSASSKVELVCGLKGVVSKDSTILEHFVKLFYVFYDNGWPTKDPKSLNDGELPPHLFLTMAVIGSACAGSRAKAFHLQALYLLRPKLVDAALHKQFTTVTVPLVQSLALIHTTMISSENRRPSADASKLLDLIIALCRKICRKLRTHTDVSGTLVQGRAL